MLLAAWSESPWRRVGEIPVFGSVSECAFPSGSRHSLTEGEDGLGTVLGVTGLGVKKEKKGNAQALPSQWPCGLDSDGTEVLRAGGVSADLADGREPWKGRCVWQGRWR